jgi:hypothetical protein
VSGADAMPSPKKLGKNLGAVYAVLMDNAWHTLERIRDLCVVRCDVYMTTPSVSARLRDLRKQEFGGHTVERRVKPGATGSVWEYRLLPRCAHLPQTPGATRGLFD